MIRICNDPAVCPVWDETYKGKTFFTSEKLFLEARNYVYAHQETDGTCYPVLNERGGEFAFWIQYTENLALGEKRNDFPDYEKRFSDKESLDFSLLDQYDKFVFTEAEEYSLAIAGLLRRYRPEKKCVFLDGRAKFFLRGKGIRFLPLSGSAGRYMRLFKRWTQGKNQDIGFICRCVCLLLYRRFQYLERKKEKKVCVVATDKDYFWPTDTVRNSPRLMYSLLWCSSRKALENQNKDKTIVILDYPCYNEGLVSIVKWTYAHIKWFSEKGYTPVVDLHTFPNQYLNTEHENMWEYFFEPVSEISVEDAHNSENVISAVGNGIILGEAKINPYQEKWIRHSINAADFNRIIKMNEETTEYVEREVPKEIRARKRVLGVVMRGTAYRTEVAKKWNKEYRSVVVDAERFLQACNYYKDELKCEYIFLATEDAEYFEMARRFCGSCMLYIDQRRSNYDYANKEYIPLNQALGLKDGKYAGRNYLSIIKSLSECTALIYNVGCGAVDMAEYWNEGRYEAVRHIEAGWKPPI